MVQGTTINTGQIEFYNVQKLIIIFLMGCDDKLGGIGNLQKENTKSGIF